MLAIAGLVGTMNTPPRSKGDLRSRGSGHAGDGDGVADRRHDGYVERREPSGAEVPLVAIAAIATNGQPVVSAERHAV